MVDVQGDVLRPPHCTTPAAVKANKSYLKLMTLGKDHDPGLWYMYISMYSFSLLYIPTIK